MRPSFPTLQMSATNKYVTSRVPAGTKRIRGTIQVRLSFQIDSTESEKVKSEKCSTTSGLILSQEMPTSAVNDALIPVKKAF